MSEPQAAKTALSFQRQLQTADADTILLMSRRWTAVEANLTGTIEALADDIAKRLESGETVPAWKLYQMERYQSLLRQIQAQLGQYTTWAADLIHTKALQAQEMGIADAVEMLAVQGVRVALDRLGVEAAEKITGLAQGGQPLDRILSSAYPTAVNAITDKLITGAALGWNPRKTAREVLRGGGLDQALNHILLVSTDQQIRNYRESQRDAYQRSGVVYGYKRIAAKNRRTCLACLALDGRIYPTSEVMQLHPRDRCSLIPLVVGRNVPQFQTGLEWFKGQSAGTQKQMLGPGRYAAWKDGRFDLDQLVTVRSNPVWGDNAQVTSLKALNSGRGGVRPPRYTASQLLALHKLNLLASGGGKMTIRDTIAR